MRFEWDEEKRLSNMPKHGFDFIHAARLFDGRVRLDARSPRGREHRILTIGELDGVMSPWPGRSAARTFAGLFR
jgi:uncharacterized DUF497 family protein